MNKSILITGIAGTGKSSVCRVLNDLGYEAHDFEDYDGMFQMYRKDNGEIYEDYDNADPEKIKNAEWRCDIKKLKELLEKQKSSKAFYCGVASNMDDIIPYFDELILLQTQPEILRGRLSNREGTDDMGNTEESRDAVLGWKDWWENEMKDKGAKILNADGTIEETAQNIITTEFAIKHLSYLMGAEKITDSELEKNKIVIANQTASGSRMLEIPEQTLPDYIKLIKSKLDNGFWNEIVGPKEILFIFKYKDGHTEEYVLSVENERKIDQLCAEFNNEPPDKTANVYKYISDNDFYHDFMMEHYKEMIER